jgi:holliday junction DNA helicase RuvA
MIDYIKGKLTFTAGSVIVVETGGVGYQIFTANPFRFQNAKDEPVTVYTYQHVREDVLALYGFQTREERRLFEKLLQVSGIGPKAALAILSSGTPVDVIDAIQNEQITFLTRFQGVGKKTAQRLIVELKDKLDEIKAGYVQQSGHIGSVSAVQNEELGQTNSSVQGTGTPDVVALEEALQALSALGYKNRETEQIKQKLMAEARRADEPWGTEQYIKSGLALLNQSG